MKTLIVPLLLLTSQAFAQTPQVTVKLSPMFDAVTVPPVLRSPVGKPLAFKEAETTIYASACTYDNNGKAVQVKDSFESGLFVDILESTASAARVKVKVVTLVAVKPIAQGNCNVDLIESKSSESIYTAGYGRGPIETVGNYQINITLE
jgi:hypothetical protein